MKMSFMKIARDEQVTQDIAASLAQICDMTAVIFLIGDLGAGKTTFTRGFLRGLGIEEKVKSPTYTLVESYVKSDQKVYHFDLYRVSQPHELEAIGLEDYFLPCAICLVEWPEKGGALLPPPDVAIYIEPTEAGREIRMEAKSPIGHGIIMSLISMQE